MSVRSSYVFLYDESDQDRGFNTIFGLQGACVAIQVLLDQGPGAADLEKLHGLATAARRLSDDLVDLFGTSCDSELNHIVGDAIAHLLAPTATASKATDSP